MLKIILVFSILLLSCTKLQDYYPKYTQKKKFKIFFIGDSMTSDDPGNISMIGNSSSRSYGWYLKQILGDSIAQYRNHAISGVGVTEMNNQATTIISEYDPSRINIVFILGCINNISFNGMSGQQCYTQMRSIHERLKISGFRTICISLTSRRQLAYFSEQQSQYFWTQITQANELFLNNYGQFSNGYLDLQKDTFRVENGVGVGFGGYETATESTYFRDGCHFSDAGNRVIAGYCKLFIK